MKTGRDPYRVGIDIEVRDIPAIQHRGEPGAGIVGKVEQETDHFDSGRWSIALPIEDAAESGVGTLCHLNKGIEFISPAGIENRVKILVSRDCVGIVDEAPSLFLLT